MFFFSWLSCAVVDPGFNRGAYMLFQKFPKAAWKLGRDGFSEICACRSADAGYIDNDGVFHEFIELS